MIKGTFINSKAEARTGGAAVSVRGLAADGAVGILGFLCGAFRVGGAFNPVGLACLASFLGEGRRFYTAAAFTALGYAVSDPALFASDYAVALALICVYGAVRGRVSYTAAGKALAAFVIFMASGFAKGLTSGDLPYTAAVYAIEGLLMFALVCLFDRGAALLCGKESLTDEIENMAGLLAIAAFACAGAAVYGGAIPMGTALAIYIFLAAGQAMGAEQAVVSGAFSAFALLLAGKADLRDFALICVLSAVTGFFGKGGRLMRAASCLAGTSALGYYFGILDPSLFFGSLAACAAYLLTCPWLKVTAVRLSPDIRAREKCEDMRDHIVKRLRDGARGIELLYDSMKNNAGDNAGRETEEMADRVACLTCDGCRLKENCWNGSYYNTYGTLMELFTVCGKKGTVDPGDLPPVFRDYCVKQDEFIEAVKMVYNGHRERLIWKMKLMESRQVASQQMKAVASMLSGMAGEMENKDIFKGSLERVLYYELKKKDSKVERVSVREGENGEYEVEVYRNGCPGRQACREITADTVGAVLGRTMKRKEKDCGAENEGACKLTLCEKNLIRVSAAAAMAIKDEEDESGDSYSFMELPGGGYMIALSDGMGSGSEAGEESRTVIELLERFSELGFKRETALSLINSALVMENDRETFATLDICCIDLYTGRAEFIKNGAAATYVIRDGTAKAIKSSSLPMGMLKYFDTDRSEYRLKRDDILLMLTDGAAEVIERGGSAKLLTAMMKDSRLKDPKDIASFVLDSLKEMSGYRVQDDMTVVAARIW